MHHHFQKFGRIHELMIGGPSMSKSDANNHVGFVTFKSADSLEAAMMSMDDRGIATHVIKGCTVQCEAVSVWEVGIVQKTYEFYC